MTSSSRFLVVEIARQSTTSGKPQRPDSSLLHSPFGRGSRTLRSSITSENRSQRDIPVCGLTAEARIRDALSPNPGNVAEGGSERFRSHSDHQRSSHPQNNTPCCSRGMLLGPISRVNGGTPGVAGNVCSKSRNLSPGAPPRNRVVRVIAAAVRDCSGVANLILSPAHCVRDARHRCLRCRARVRS